MSGKDYAEVSRDFQRPTNDYDKCTKKHIEINRRCYLSFDCFYVYPFPHRTSSEQMESAGLARNRLLYLGIDLVFSKERRKRTKGDYGGYFRHVYRFLVV